MAKTQVTDESLTVSGTLSMLNQDENPGGAALPTKKVDAAAGGCYCVIEDITESGWNGPDPQPDPPWGEFESGKTVALYIALEDAYTTEYIMDHKFEYFETGDEPFEVSGSYSISVDANRRILRTETLTPSGDRDDAPAYAADRDVEDEWTEEGHPYSWSVSFAGLSSSGTQEWDEVFLEYKPSINPVSTAGIHVNQPKGNAEIQYVDASINWDAVTVDLSRYHKELSHWTWEGVSSGVEVWYGEYNGDNPTPSHSMQIAPPHSWDFGLRHAAVDWEGNPHSDYCLSGPWQASNHLSASLDWATTPDGETFEADVGDTVYPTVDELYAVGEYADPGNVTGLDYRDPDDEYKFFTSGTMQVSLTKQSVEREDLVAKYGHYSGDLEVLMRIPPLDVSKCDSNPDESDVMSMTVRSGVGIYGPADGGEHALSHTDWAGGDNTSNPDASGAFTVSGGEGALTLDLPSNFGDRLDAVPEENFPDGMPGYPQQYLYHRAGVWREYHGETCPDGTTHDEPLEAVYCWRGFPALDLSDWTVPVDCTLAITLSVITYDIYDPHTTDSTRQTEATNTPSQDTYTYTVSATASGGIPIVMLGVPDVGGGEPDLEVVTSIQITGLGEGDWTLTEPELGGDPDSTASPTIKIFESPRDDYRHGGFSGVVDHVCHYALMDSLESNGGHSTRLEPTVRMFDHVHSPPDATNPVDLTTAWDRTQVAAVLSNVGDAFRATRQEASFESHYMDDDNAYLTSGYAFDFCASLSEDRALEQTLGGINFAVRARAWTSVTGMLYGAYFDHVGGGAMQGQAVDDSGNLLRSETSESIYRQPQGSDPEEWALVETPTSDSAGYWRSSSGEVYESYDPATVLWEYGIGEDSDEVTPSGRWETRGYGYASILAVRGRWLRVFTDPVTNVQWCSALKGDDLVVKQRQTSLTAWSDDIVVDSSGDYEVCDITGDGSLLIVLAITPEGQIDEFYSRNEGDDWEGPYTI